MDKEEFKNKLNNILIKEKNKNNYLDIIFLCIGTDRMTGDSFGPLVGTKLKENLEKYNISNINIYGTLEKNVSFTNIVETLNIIKERHKNACIIGIDSALSNKENIGKIFLEEKQMVIGNGLNKRRIEVGDICIKGVVGKNCKFPQYNFKLLQNVSLNLVMNLADIVSNGIIEVVNNVY